MKLLALALVLFLAVGSQAAALQADAPNQLEQIRSAVAVYVQQVRASAHRALDQLDDTEYSAYKAQLKQSLDNAHAQLATWQGSAAPYTDAFVNQFMESTEAVRESISADIRALQADIEPKSAVLKSVVDRHIADYRARLEPIIKEYSAVHQAEMDTLKAKLEPIMDELRAKVSTNVDETRAALMPIVDTVRAKLNERLEELKKVATPYVNEYKEQLTAVYQQARERASSLNAEEIQAQVASLKEQTGPVADEFRAKLQGIYDLVMASVNTQ